MLSGIIRKVVNLFDSEIKSFENIIQDTFKECETKGIYWYSFKLDELDVLNSYNALSEDQKSKFALYCLKSFEDFSLRFKNDYQNQSKTYHIQSIKTAFIKTFLSSKPNLATDYSITWIQVTGGLGKLNSNNLNSWGFPIFLHAIKPRNKKENIPLELQTELKNIKSKLLGQLQRHEDKPLSKLIDKLDILLGEFETKEWYLPDNDAFGSIVNDTLRNLAKETQKEWFNLISNAAAANGSKPTEKFLKLGNACIERLKVDGFRELMHSWLEHIISLPDQKRNVRYEWLDNARIYEEVCLSSPQNLDYFKALIWLLVRFHDHKTTSLISKAAERAFKKIPGKGPTAMALGNACIYVLAHQKGFDGIAELSKLNNKIKVVSVKKLIAKYLTDNADKRGLQLSELEDLACDSYGLVDGKKDFFLGEFTATIQLIKPGKTNLVWTNNAGKEQVSIPQSVKEYQKEKLAKLKATCKQIETTTTVQKERFDLKLRSNTSLTMDYFKENYLKHGILGWIARRCIWNFSNEQTTIDVLFYEGEWRDNLGNIFRTTDFTKVQIWHPAEAELASVLAWRQLISEREIRQPIKQAFREIYLLTEAEINTDTYSNRMAAHLLKQHQFINLAKGRGWKANLMGAWDGGYDGIASLQLNEFGLLAEFWTNAVDQDDQMNEAGIWNYLSTDQVRFVHVQSGEPQKLEDIPVRIFSEVMRDVDLFVGVASVGNDPAWRDNGGLPAYTTHWLQYSFGDLGEMAKSRKQLLERLIPRLKIAEQSSFEGNFLKIKGKLRTYKIHIGSSNILMEPNDQYLCIIPDNKKTSHEETIYLPFEGDRILSLIVSKALLLANDTKIKDATITSQINKGL